MVSPLRGVGLPEGNVVPGRIDDPDGIEVLEEIGEPIDMPPEDSEMPELIGVSYDPITVSPYPP
jgi:hypothetical protein